MKPADLSRAEIMQYLHAPKLDSTLSAMLDTAMEELCAVIHPRTLWCVCPVSRTDSGIALGTLPLRGKDIAEHLTGCTEAVLLGATLSGGVDSMIRRAQQQDMTRALLYDAIAGAAVETVCNALEQQIKARFADKYAYFTERFSPGYGDFPLTQQRELIALLDAPRKIGLTVTPHCTMLPMKSVTALIGLSNQPVHDARRFTCGRNCSECPYRESCSMSRSDRK